MTFRAQKFEAKMNGHTKRQITLFIGVIETKFENPRKGLEALFKNLVFFFADVKTRETVAKMPPSNFALQCRAQKSRENQKIRQLFMNGDITTIR